MRCSTCRAENAPEAQFCSQCGHSVEARQGVSTSMATCTNCGSRNPRQFRMCSRCGASIEGLAGSERASAHLLAEEYRGFWIRLGAQLIDAFAVFGVGVILSILSLLIPILGLLYFPLFFFLSYKEIKCQTLGR